MVAQPSALATKIPGRIFFPGRSASLSSQIIADVRDALFAKKLKPGDVLGTENEIAARYGVSRIVARDALRTLQALGIAEIRMGKGGGARVARGNPRLFAEALAVQLDLTGVSAAEIMDAQRAIECLAAELAAENATDEDIARLRQLVADAEASIDDAARFTELGARIPSRRRRGLAQPRAGGAAHLAAARVLAAAQSDADAEGGASAFSTFTRNCSALIEIRDAAGARKLMDDHVKMIRARRVSEHARSKPLSRSSPRKRGPRATSRASGPWVPACAGTNGVRG